MNSILKADLSDLSEILEAIVARLPKMKEADQIDVAARLKRAEKHIKTIDDAVKHIIKSKPAVQRLEGGTDHSKTTVLGGTFAADVSVFPVERLDQTKLKLLYPKEHAECSNTADECRVTYAAR